MPRKHDKPEDIVMKLRQIKVLNSQGMVIAQAAREVGTTEQTYYRWRKHYGGMGTGQLQDVVQCGVAVAGIRLF
jgi:transposase-like protein|tara:strand:- start:3472 stop:3693 length:222 start_codon:yes stop_codon:yes gene_type:complete